MQKQTFEVGTLTLNNELQRMRESYGKCALLNVIEHIDIYGLDEKLSKFSMTTKTSGLYPGNDILSKRMKQQKLKNFTTKNNIAFGTVVLR